MARLLPWLLAFFLVIGAGVAQGLRTDRWSLSNEPAATAAKLNDLPMKIGEWEATKDEEMDVSQKDLAEIVGYKMRAYIHAETNKTVRILIACGRPGPIAVHTPDVCFGGAGYEMSQPKRQTVDFLKGVPAAEFNSARFVRNDSMGVPMRICWAWSTDDAWSVPNNPRLSFASARALFKLYVISDLTGSDELKEGDPCLSLLRSLLPELHARLAPAS